jgi:hypothetical protein
MTPTELLLGFISISQFVIWIYVRWIYLRIEYPNDEPPSP